MSASAKNEKAPAPRSRPGALVIWCVFSRLNQATANTDGHASISPVAENMPGRMSAWSRGPLATEDLWISHYLCRAQELLDWRPSAFH
jgi:hypothetical protein